MSLILRFAQTCLKKLTTASIYRNLLCLIYGVSSGCLRFAARLAQLRCPQSPLVRKCQYTYQPLATPRHIRTFEFCPTSNTCAEICLRIKHVDIDSPATRYTAISFVYGDRKLSPVVSIRLDGDKLEIPQSLNSTLARLRSLGQNSQCFWASAICINQEETEIGLAEKSLQVRMMDDVYSKAEEVIVDLGDADEDTEELLMVLDRYQLITESTWFQIDIKASQSSVAHSIELCTAMNLPGPTSRFWHSFRRFMCRPWFIRVWIVQEFALSQKARLMVGSQFRDKQFLRNAVSRAATHLEILYVQDRFHSAAREPNKTLGDAIWDVLPKSHAVHRICLAAEQADTSRNLCELLDATTTYFKATKECDRVYALLGMATDATIKSDVAVDYNESLANFTLRKSQYILQRQAGKYVLYHSVGDRAGYSSWTIDLQGPPDGLPHLMNPDGRLKYGDFMAGGPMNFECHVSESRIGGITVRACLVDIVQTAMAQGIPHNSELTTHEALVSHSVWLMHAVKWMLDAATIQPLPLSKFTKLCWRAIVADLIMPSESEGRGYCRMRDWAESARCLDTVDTVFRAAYRKWIGELPASYTMDLTSTQLNDIRIYGDSISHTTGRKLAMSHKLNGPCLVPSESRIGDRIVVVEGCQMPFIMRLNSDEKGDYYRLLGCAYVHGVMDGEIVRGQDWEFTDLEIC